MARALNARDDDDDAHHDEAGWADVGGDTVHESCSDRWRAAAPESRKKMFALFAACGVFVAVCRHGHLLVMCDMVNSSEL